MVRLICLALIINIMISCDDTKKEGERSAGETVAGEAAAGEAVAGEAVAGEAVAGEAVAGEAVAGEAVAGEAVAGEAASDSWTTSEIYEGLRPTCESCHGQGLSLASFANLAEFERLIVADPTWVVPGAPAQSGLINLLEGNYSGAYAQMPPSGETYANMIAGVGEAPSMEEIIAWIEALELGSIEPELVECADRPARGVMARLSRSEYRNATRDLLGTDLDPGADFPSENESYGFSHISSLLTLSPLLLEKYDLAAMGLASEALPLHTAPVERFVLEGETDLSSSVGSASGDFWNLWSNGLLSTFFTPPSAGVYRFEMSVAGGQAGPDPVRFALVIDGEDIQSFESTAQNPDRDVLTFDVELSNSEHQIGVRFLNDYYCPQDRFDTGECLGLGDRNLYLDRIVISGPQEITVSRSVFEERFLTCDPAESGFESCAREVITRFGRLAWRRPMTRIEVERLWNLVSADFSETEPTVREWREGMRQALHATLLSPYFIFRVERAADGQALNAFERATRLAAFLWRSIPDEVLLDAAENGELDTPEGQISEVDRMLNDPKALALIKDFGGRWMQLHHLDSVEPDYAIFSQFDEELRQAMSEESTRSLMTAVSEERSLLDLVNLDFTWVNARLADFYGMNEAYNEAAATERRGGYRRISLPQAGRLGFLTHGSWLTHTSQPTRTSPVVRGKWVLENLLCSPPPPPPPGVEGLPESTVDQNASVRERFEQHRADPACAACHTHMDAIGFGFEPFSGIGEFRVVDGNEVIDPSGELPTDPPLTFEDTIGLVNALRADDALPRCVTERMIIYAIGRGLNEDEFCFVDQVMNQSAQLSLQSLARSIAGSVMMNQQGVSP